MNNQIDQTLANSGAEKFILQEQDIKVSNLRFITGNQTYAMSGITSVKFEKIGLEIIGPIIFFLLAVCFYIGSGVVNLFVIIFLGFSVAMVFSQVGRCSVTLGTSGGEIKSYVSRDGKFIKKIVNALNEAIILRG